MNSIYYTICSKVLCRSLLSRPTPRGDSLMQIEIVETLIVSNKLLGLLRLGLGLWFGSGFILYK